MSDRSFQKAGKQVIPRESVLFAEQEQYGYADCFSVPLVRDDVESRELVAAFFSAAPAWVDILFELRNRLVGPLGLKTGEGAPRVIDPPYRIGQRIGVFRILHLDGQEAVLGEDDKHLDFRTSLRVIHNEGGTSLAVSSLVNTKNRLGVVYFALVKPFHRLIVPVVARGMVRQIEGRLPDGKTGTT
jgi:hypothetical protein